MIEQGQKRPCADCRCCQWCSDDRCRLCLGSGGSRQKLSIRQQIELFERLTADEEKGADGGGGRE